ncbi:TonB-dependent receptor plug domain-containing protein [Pseudochryseolinea flava]|uniref:Alpha-2-macroglobulin domain-containing protein n=1 Tax=Pseudochryseolinea flava TaxID=2059302 RepID=A0A364Y2M8_9BACT|nr:TonB-dependent receptor plug domain-containing protein [Pseudochryseolinea flava]RAW00932.1 hypothetical protein DQQ10_11865 [Pseudochryseolinea flava]
MKKYYTFILAIGIIVIALMSFNVSEDPILQNLKNSWKQYANTYPEEKVYLQTDKPFFKPGETIWFNTFLVNSNTNKPSTISDVVYVTLKDPKGNVYATHELFVQDGTSRGDFTLDTGAPGGIYTITAYTRWMQNFGEENFFKKKVQVQQVITPRLLLTLDFEKEAYGRGDEVIAELKTRDLQNRHTKDASIHATVKINGQEINDIRLVVGDEEKTKIKFTLPSNLQSSDGLLQVLVDYNGQQESISRSIPIVLNKISLSFYPEGGDAVVGTLSKIAFIARNEFKKGADVYGEIIDEQGLSIVDFHSFHMGMGAFTFTPKPGKRYFAHVLKPSGNENEKFELPSIKTNTFSLSIIKRKTGITCSINSPNETVAFVVGKTHNEIYHAEKISLTKGLNEHVINVDKFPAGIATFTLFNGEGLEEAERLVFLNSQKTLNVTIMTDKKDYMPSEKINLKVKTTDEHGKGVASKLSLSVVDDQLISFADDKQDNILSWLLLSSELKGEIQEPSFYFNREETKAEDALDLLLLTHGWRRYNWKDVLKNDRAILYVPENNSSISGTIKNGDKAGSQQEVVLMELGNRRRLAKVKTTTNGQFSFKNIDASTPVVLLTKKPQTIQVLSRGITVQQDMSPVVAANDDPLKMKEIRIAMKDDVAKPVIEDDAQEAGFDLKMDADVASLNEVVVVGYGMQNKKDLTGSIAYIEREEISPLPNLQNALQGRVAGVVVTPNGTPGQAANVRIRGFSSVSASAQPLYVIDNYPISSSINSNDNPLNMINPDDIESIFVLHSPEGSALYGSAGANGVIVITTKSRSAFSQMKKRKAIYNSITLEPRKFTTTRDFFVPITTTSPGERKNFNTTVYWNSAITTDVNGEANVSFNTNEAASAFRITAEGISGMGLIGRAEEVYTTQLPFSIDVKIPNYLSFEDTLRLPVMIKNITTKNIDGTINIEIPNELRSLHGKTTSFNISANQTKTIYFPIVTTSTKGQFPINITLASKDYHDNISHTIDVQPNGFPMMVSYSGKDLKRKLRFDIGDIEKGSLQGSINVYTDVLSDLFSGAEGILREPHGCFEQTSASTYPNILALQYMKESGQVKPDIERKAIKYIGDGYKRLTSFEVAGGGFEWFGSPPAHEGLTAYGLMEFHEMKKVFPDVDDDLILRTKKWLLDRRKGDGTFKQSEGKYDEFGDGVEVITNAYICFALSETGVNDIAAEYSRSLSECVKSKDLYRMALMANTAYNLGKKEDYQMLTDYYSNAVATGFDKMNVTRSVVRGYGESLKIETVALWSIALMKSIRSNMNLINSSARYLLEHREYGMFGSTQGTILSLKALTAYAQYTRTLRSDGDFIVTVNNSIDRKHYTSNTRERITMQDFSRNLRSGSNTVEIAFEKTKEPLPYALDVVWNSKTPASSTDCKVKLSTILSKKSLNRNETVRLMCELANITNEGLPMTVALVAIPAGLSAQPWQLKELQEKGLFDFYEVIGNKLAFYYRGLTPRAKIDINLDLKAEVPGTYESSASCAYLYYADEFKHWVKGTSVRIE